MIAMITMISQEGDQYPVKGDTCYYSHKTGPIKFPCRKLKIRLENWKDDQSKEKRATIEKNNITAIMYDDGEVSIACDDGFATFKGEDSTWVIDSVASFYVTSRRDLFTYYKQRDFGIMKIENNGVCKIFGCCNQTQDFI